MQTFHNLNEKLVMLYIGGSFSACIELSQSSCLLHLQATTLQATTLKLGEAFENMPSSIFRGTLNEGPKRRVRWNRTILLVKSHKLNLRPLDEGPRARSAKLKWYQHDMILERKWIGLDKKKELKMGAHGPLENEVAS